MQIILLILSILNLLCIITAVVVIAYGKYVDHTKKKINKGDD